MRNQWLMAFAFCCTLTVFSGCGGAATDDTVVDGDTSTGVEGTGNSGSNSNPPDNAADSGPKTYAMSDLSTGVGDYLPPLDGGRVELAPPNDWQVPLRKTGYLAWFKRFKNGTTPRIEVTTTDAPEGSIDATKANVEAYAKWLNGYVESQLGPEEELLEPVVPLILADNAWGRYVRAGKLAGGVKIERQILVTTQHGRLYQVELVVFPDDLRENRDAAYAVAAAMKFSAEGEGTAIESSFGEPGGGGS